MATQVPNINKISNGLCPHGLPPGACPICSKMAGGSSGGLRAGERPQKAGEMSYHECVVMGEILRSRAMAKKRHVLMLEKQAEAIKNFETTLAKLTNSLKLFLTNNSNNLIFKPIVTLVNIVILPILNTIKFIPKILQKFQLLKFDIQDKLNAIFGEIKNFIQKKITELVSILNLKLKKLFKILKKQNVDDDDTKIDDDKKIFNLKNILKKIVKRKNKDGNDNNNNKRDR